MKENLIEAIGKKVWAITLAEPTMNVETVKNLPEVKHCIANSITGTPYFEANTARYWYLVDKPFKEDEEFDYLKGIYLDAYIGSELTQDTKDAMTFQGYQDRRITLTPQDRLHIERHIEDGDQIELVSKDGKERMNAFIANLKIITVRPDQHYEATFTLTRIS